MEKKNSSLSTVPNPLSKLAILYKGIISAEVFSELSKIIRKHESNKEKADVKIKVSLYMFYFLNVSDWNETLDK